MCLSALDPVELTFWRFIVLGLEILGRLSCEHDTLPWFEFNYELKEM